VVASELAIEKSQVEAGPVLVPDAAQTVLDESDLPPPPP